MIKDYDLEVHYHPGKANVVADALSRRAHCNLIEARPTARVLCCEIGAVEIELGQLHESGQQAEIFNITIEMTIKSQIIEAQRKDKGMEHIRAAIN